MDETDRRIVAECAGDLPGSMTPWAEVAASLGIGVEELIRRLERMRQSGVLRGVRAVLDQRALGLEGNVLVAWEVGEDRLDEVARLFASRREVSHCVLRAPAPGWPYTLYTMIHAESAQRAQAVVDEMAQGSGIRECVRLETVRELKKSPPRYF